MCDVCVCVCVHAWDSMCMYCIYVYRLYKGFSFWINNLGANLLGLLLTRADKQEDRPMVDGQLLAKHGRSTNDGKAAGCVICL